MALRVSRATVLRDALSYRSEARLERALGRAVRRHGGDYEDYLAIMTAVREYGRERRIPLKAATKALANQP